MFTLLKFNKLVGILCLMLTFMFCSADLLAQNSNKKKPSKNEQNKKKDDPSDDENGKEDVFMPLSFEMDSTWYYYDDVNYNDNTSASLSSLLTPLITSIKIEAKEEE